MHSASGCAGAEREKSKPEPASSPEPKATPIQQPGPEAEPEPEPEPEPQRAPVPVPQSVDMDAGVLEVLTEFGLEGFAATIAAQLGVSKAAVRTLRSLVARRNSVAV
eukprot:COSAG04_NODE_300_length_17427_cov_16.169725_12_plen_107_part_00